MHVFDTIYRSSLFAIYTACILFDTISRCSIFDKLHIQKRNMVCENSTFSFFFQLNVLEVSYYFVNITQGKNTTQVP